MEYYPSQGSLFATFCHFQEISKISCLFFRPIAIKRREGKRLDFARPYPIHRWVSMSDRKEPGSQHLVEVAALRQQIADLVAAQRCSLQHQEKCLRQILTRVKRERSAIADAIHDGLCQRLVAAKMHLEACRHHRGGRTSAGIASCATASQHLDDAIAEARRLMARLKSSWTAKSGRRGNDKTR